MTDLDPTELARKALEAAARARRHGDEALSARLLHAADDDGRISVDDALGALAGEPAIPTELRAVNADKHARNRELLRSIHEPPTEEDQ
ncbi:MAG: hypothetical protein M3433_02650 [Actinomycetota bacterium]|nr:hypothetical protein [Actinomycetota bacterium]